MTARARLTIILALSSIPVFAGAAEERVTFSVDGLTVVGTLNLPNGVDNPPAILLLHGFTGSRDKLEIPALRRGRVVMNLVDDNRGIRRSHACKR